MTKRMTAFCLAILLSLSACAESQPRTSESGIETEVTTTEPEITTTEPETTMTESEITTTEPETAATIPEVTTTETEASTTEPETAATEPKTLPAESGNAASAGKNKTLSLTVTENDSGYYDTKYLLTNIGNETVSEIRGLLQGFGEFAENDGMRINYPNGNVEMIDWEDGVPDLENSEKYFNALSAMDYDENCDLLAPGESMEIYTHTEGKEAVQTTAPRTTTAPKTTTTPKTTTIPKTTTTPKTTTVSKTAAPAPKTTTAGAAETGKFSASDKQSRKQHIYIYDEETDSGWYLDDDDWDDWDDDDWDWDDWDDDDWDWDDKALIEVYADQGIEKNGKSYYYRGELVYIIKDQRPDSSFYMLDRNSKGTVSIKVIRNIEGDITGVSYMTEEEIAELLERAVGETEEIPVINMREWDNSAFSVVEAYYKTDNIYILPSTTGKVVLKEYLTEDKPDYYAVTELKNDVLAIRSGDRPSTNYKSFIEIYVPEDVLDNVKVETVGGAITVEDYTGVVSLSAMGGGISVFDSNISGNINTVSGVIGLYLSDISGDLFVQSHSGKILAVFPTSVSYNIKAETSTGKIKGSYFDTKSGNEKEFSGNVGSNPKQTITLKTFSASIEIN